MAVEYQNKSEVKVTANATSITIPVPTGFSAGDLLIAIVTKDDDPAIVLPTGGTWTLIQGGTGGDPQMHFSVSYRIAVAGDTSWTWTGDNEQWYGVILRYTGQASSGFIHASGKADGDSATPTAPSVSYTDLEAGSLALHCFGQDYDRIPYISPDNLLERYSGDAAGCGGAGGEKATIIDSYDKANTDAETSINNIRFKVGQSFTATTDTLGFAKFYIYKVGSPVGNIVAKLYSHSGTYGSSSVPNTLLATSDALSLADMPTVPTLITFTFTGANKYSLTNGTKYCITIESDDCDATNYIRVQWDSSSPTHSGNALYYTTSWIALNTSDTIFYVLSANVVISGSGSTGTAIFTTDGADEWLAVTVVIEAEPSAGVVELAGEVQASASTNGIMALIWSLAGEINGAGQTDGILKPTRSVIGAINGISQTDAKLLRIFSINGTVAGQSQIDGTLLLLKLLAGIIQAQSQTDGNIVLTLGLTGVIDALSETLGDITIGGVIEIVGAVNALSQVDGNIIANWALMGDIGGVSQTVGALVVLRDLIGAIDAQSQTDVQLAVLRDLIGNIQSQSQTTGLLKKEFGIIGAIDALSQTDGQLAILRDLLGTINAQSQTDGKIVSTWSLIGDIDALSQTLGDLSLIGIIELVGIINAISQTDGLLKKEFGIIGAVNALSQTDGQLAVLRDLIGTVNASGQTVSQLAILRDLVGIINAISQTDGSLLRIFSIDGAIDGQSQTDGLLALTRGLRGIVVAESQTLADLFVAVTKYLVGQIDAQSQTGGFVVVDRTLTGIINALSEVTGAVNLITWVELVGAINALSQIDGAINMITYVELQGAIAAISDLLSDLDVR